jgi:23S rRNA (uracil1939-C5)-methyltransferase
MVEKRLHVFFSLTDMAHGGSALGRHEGKVIFVPYALPGEEVTVEILEDKRRFARARLLELHAASPDRVVPPCPFFGECGGCQWQHASYPAQLAFKTAIVRDQLIRLGKFADPPVRDTLASPEPWHYRNHAQLTVDRRGRLGFRAAASRRIVPVDECLLLHPLLDELFLGVDLDADDDLPPLKRLSLRAGINTGDQMIIFETAGDEPPQLEVDFPVSCVLLLEDGTPVNLVGYNHITERVAGRIFRISAGSFFQVNTPQTETLVRLVTEYLAPGGDETLLDAYCGVGTFALTLAEEVSHVIGVESALTAVEDFQINAEGMEKVAILPGAVEEVLPGLEMPVDLAVVDPPRTGVHPEALAALARLAPQRIVYVSCDPATLARDGRALAEAGYNLAVVQPVDMFSQTYHVETVSLWVKGRRM